MVENPKNERMILRNAVPHATHPTPINAKRSPAPLYRPLLRMTSPLIRIYVYASDRLIPPKREPSTAKMSEPVVKVLERSKSVLRPSAMRSPSGKKVKVKSVCADGPFCTRSNRKKKTNVEIIITNLLSLLLTIREKLAMTSFINYVL